MPPPPKSLVPFLDSASDEDLGKLLRAAVGIVRSEAGHDRGDVSVQVEVRVTLRAPTGP